MDKSTAIETLLNSVGRLTGDAFFGAVVKEVRQLFDADDVFIAFALNSPPTRARIHHVSSASDDIGDLDYDLSESPCRLVYERGEVIIPCDLAEKFDSEDYQVDQSFIGIPIFDHSGDGDSPISGHLAIYSQKAIEDSADVMDVARQFGQRIQAEINRVRWDDERKRLMDEISVERDQFESVNKMKSRFIHFAAHDIWNWTNTISGAMRLARLGGDKVNLQKREELYDMIESAAANIESLVHDYLDFALLEQQQMELKSAPFDISGLIANRVDLCRLQAGRKEIEVQLSAPPFLEMEGDAGKIGQVFDNLMSNALKYSSSGGTVRAKLALDGPTVTLTVADQGPGIAPDQIDHLFDPFHTSVAKPTGGEKSFGLGLAIVKSIIDCHGGTIAAENDDEGGAVFTVHLPRVQST